MISLYYLNPVQYNRETLLLYGLLLLCLIHLLLERVNVGQLLVTLKASYTQLVPFMK